MISAPQSLVRLELSTQELTLTAIVPALREASLDLLGSGNECLAKAEDSVVMTPLEEVEL
jgi:hypothetical protein